MNEQINLREEMELKLNIQFEKVKQLESQNKKIIEKSRIVLQEQKNMSNTCLKEKDTKIQTFIVEVSNLQKNIQEKEVIQLKQGIKIASLDKEIGSKNQELVDLQNKLKSIEQNSRFLNTTLRPRALSENIDNTNTFNQQAGNEPSTNNNISSQKNKRRFSLNISKETNSNTDTFQIKLPQGMEEDGISINDDAISNTVTVHIEQNNNQQYLRVQINELNNQIKEIEREKNDLEKEKNDIIQEKTLLNQTIIKDEQEIRRLEAKIEQLCIDITKLESENHHLEDRVTQLKDKNDILQQNLTSKNIENSGLNSIIETLKVESRQLNSSNQEIQQINKNLISKVEDLKNSKKILKEVKEGLEDSNRKLVSQNEDLSNQNHEFAGDIKKLEEKNKILSSKNVEHISEIEKLEDVCMDFDSNLTRANQILTQRQDKINELREHRDAILDQVGSFQ